MKRDTKGCGRCLGRENIDFKKGIISRDDRRLWPRIANTRDLSWQLYKYALSRASLHTECFFHLVQLS